MNKGILALLGCMLLLGCTKTYQEALPTVQMVSVTAFGGDSLILTGKVTSQGAAAPDYVGFAYSESPNFDMTSNQILGNGTTGTFYTVMVAKPDSTYYFKCFADNKFGYAVSTNYKFTVPSSVPQTAPCTLTNNTVIDQGNTYTLVDINYDNTYPSYGNVGVETDNGFNEFVDIYFVGTPVNGIYTTTTNTSLTTDPNPYDCLMLVNNNYVVSAGAKIYVAQTGSGSATISFCSVLYLVSSTKIYISGKISY